MSIRIAVYCHESRPLSGLCAQLQCAGYDVFERYTKNAYLDLIDEERIDIALLDADAKEALPLLKGLGASLDERHYRLVLVTQQHSIISDDLLSGIDVDDIIVLPVPRDDLRYRIRNIVRYASMKAEWTRRQQVFSDYDVMLEDVRSGPTTIGRSQILLVGAIGEEQVSLIDLLGNIATFSYAETMDHALHLLRQGYVDIIYINNDVAPNDIQKISHELRRTHGLADIPILVSDQRENSLVVEIACREGNLDRLRIPSQAAGIKKRVQMLARQYHLKRQLRGMSTDNLYASTVDGLTDLYSRGFFYHYLERALEQNREQGTMLSIATCTISGLDDVNDMLGYPTGDRLIRQLGKALAVSCRAQDLIARIRGVSFCVVLCDIMEHEARMICERTSEILKSVIDSDGSNLLSHVHLSMGMAEASVDDRADWLVNRALRQSYVTALDRDSCAKRMAGTTPRISAAGSALAG